MKPTFFKKTIILFSSLLLSVNCLASEVEVNEVKIKEITLAPPLNSPLSQISTLAWCQDYLVLLPQKPGFETLNPNDDGTNTQLVSKAPHYLYTIKKSAIEKYLDTANPKPLAAKQIVLDDTELQALLPGFDGYESLNCSGNQFWFSVETIHTLQEYRTTIYAAQANLNSEKPKITINPKPFAVLGSLSNTPNHSHEASVIINNKLVSIHEINSAAIVGTAHVAQTDLKTGKVSELAFPNIPFRITDASAADDQNRFWVSNYHYPGSSLFFLEDLKQYKAVGKTHKTHQQVERLIEFQLLDNKIVRTKTKPFYLQLNSKNGRNWEGLVRLNKDGFLLITDQHPSTVLGFVAYPN